MACSWAQLPLRKRRARKGRSQKASAPIPVTPSGMTTEIREVHSLKAPLPTLTMGRASLFSVRLVRVSRSVILF